MTSKNTTTETAESRTVGPHALLGLMDDEYRSGVVRRTLEARKSASRGAVQSLSHHIDTHIRGVSGFRRSSEAHTVLIEERLAVVAQREDDLAVAILRVWIETNEQLKNAIAAGLQDEGVIDNIPTDRVEIISIGTPNPGVQKAIDDINHTGQDFNEDDVILMAYCLSRWMPELDEDDVDLADISEPEDSPREIEPEESFVLRSEAFSPILQHWRRSLNDLPADAPEFDYIDKEFVDQILGIADSVREQKENAAELSTQVGRLESDYHESLSFFGWEKGKTLSETKERWMRQSEALRLVTALIESLESYATVPSQGTTFAEQQQFDLDRAETGNNILATIKRIDGLELKPHEEPREVVDVADDEDSAKLQKSDTREGGPQEESLEHVRSQLNASQRQEKRLNDDYDKLSRGYARLEKDTSDLKKEVGTLKDRLKGTRTDAADQERQVPGADDAPVVANIPRPDFPSVKDVVERAKVALSDQLDFRLNKASNPDTPFARPNEVAASLEWLADTYYRNKKGEISVPNLAGSLKESTTWDYAPFQSDVTTGKYPSEYKTKVNGREIRLLEHIGKGTDSPENTIRIAFDWDEESQKVIIGYVGPHQRNKAS